MLAVHQIADHLWQSTLIWLIVWAITLWLHNHSARVRFRLWLLASIKFLLPFGLLSRLVASLTSTHLQPNASTTAVSQTATIVESPFTRLSPHAFIPVEHVARASIGDQALGFGVILLWAFGALCVALPWARQVFRLRRVVQEAQPLGTIEAVRLLSTAHAMEPAVFGWSRPILLLPCGLEQRLDQAEMRVLLAHELSHVRRRDNLWTTLHLLVTTIFWFDPAVWIIRSKMLRERELACDEAVVAEIDSPELYAESILRVCRWYLEAMPGCTAGISGANLQERIQRILAGAPSLRLGGRLQGLLFLIGSCIIALPCISGIAQTGSVTQGGENAQGPAHFEVISIHPAPKNARGMSVNFTHDRFEANDVTAGWAVVMAFHLQDFQVKGLPHWANTIHYTIVGTVNQTVASMPDNQEKLNDYERMEQAMLADRFHLTYHWETRQLPIYSLEVGQGGAKIKRAVQDEHYGEVVSDDLVKATGMSMDEFAQQLGLQLDRSVVNATSLPGNYDLTLDYRALDGNTDETTGHARLFSALEDELGLKLVQHTGPVRILVVDRIEQPTAN